MTTCKIDAIFTYTCSGPQIALVVCAAQPSQTQLGRHVTLSKRPPSRSPEAPSATTNHPHLPFTPLINFLYSTYLARSRAGGEFDSWFCLILSFGFPWLIFRRLVDEVVLRPNNINMAPLPIKFTELLQVRSFLIDYSLTSYETDSDLTWIVDERRDWGMKPSCSFSLLPSFPCYCASTGYHVAYRLRLIIIDL